MLKIKSYKKEVVLFEEGPIKDTRMETRYRIEDEDGKIINDAQGYGFSSFEKAKKYLNYKNYVSNISNETLNKNRQIIAWAKKNEEIINKLRRYYEDDCWYAIKDNIKGFKLTTDKIKEYLGYLNLTEDSIPFDLKDIVEYIKKDGKLITSHKLGKKINK